MTLTEIWRRRTQLWMVAARPDSDIYVPLGLKDWRDLEELDDAGRNSTEWYLAEIIPHDCDAMHPEEGYCELRDTENQFGEKHICRDVHLNTFRCAKHGQVDRFVKHG